MSAIAKTLASLKGEGALIAYVMGGDPDIETSQRVVEALIAGGADIVEVGIPFSDPIADGKSIQEAGVRSLAAGTRPSDVLKMVSELKRKHKVPIAIMTYYNILFSPGLKGFLDRAKEAGVDGVIIPDLPMDETGDYSEIARKEGLDTILLAAPTTSPARMSSLVKHTSGFLYLVSLLGVTGARSQISPEALQLVKSAKAKTKGKVPLGVGFGISTPEQVRMVLDAGADAVIVGSAIVNKVASGKEKAKMLMEVQDYVRSLKAATRKTK